VCVYMCYEKTSVKFIFRNIIEIKFYFYVDFIASLTSITVKIQLLDANKKNFLSVRLSVFENC
jgi:hypothetical protein